MRLLIRPEEDFDIQVSNALGFYISNNYLEVVGERGSGKTKILTALVDLHLMSGGRVGFCCHRQQYLRVFQKLVRDPQTQYLGWFPLDRAIRQLDRVFTEARSRQLSLIVFDELPITYNRTQSLGFGVACAYTPERNDPPKNLRERVLRMVT